jgi:hypothetical protein
MKEFEWPHLVMIAPSIPLIWKRFVWSGSIRFYILAWVIGNTALSRGIQIRLSRWGISAQYVFDYMFERHLCTHGHLERCFMPVSTGSTGRHKSRRWQCFSSMSFCSSGSTGGWPVVPILTGGTGESLVVPVGQFPTKLVFAVNCTNGSTGGWTGSIGRWPVVPVKAR